MSPHRRWVTFAVFGMLTAVRLHAQVPRDSLAAWTARLQSGTFPERASATAGLSTTPGAALTLAAQNAIVAELQRVNTAIQNKTTGFAGEAIAAEDFGNYYVSITVLAAQLNRSDALLALIPAVGVSRGVQRRVARLGDQAVPILIAQFAADFEAAGSLEALALAWHWADSTGAPLSLASRNLILGQLSVASHSPISSQRIAAARALVLIDAAAFAPLALSFAARATASSDIAAGLLSAFAVPRLSAIAAAATPAQLVAELQLIQRSSCYGAKSGARLGACTSLGNQLDEAARHMSADRMTPAREVLNAIVSRVQSALAVGALTIDEAVLIGDGASRIVARL